MIEMDDNTIKNSTKRFFLRFCFDPTFSAIKTRLQACWTPKYIKEKQRKLENDPEQLARMSPNTTMSRLANSALSYNPAPSAYALQQQQQQPLTAEQQIELSFNKFKKRLHFASTHWLNVKNGNITRADSVAVSYILF